MPSCILVQTAVNAAHFTPVGAHCTCNYLHCTLFEAYFTLHTLLCTLGTVHCTLYIAFIYCITMLTVQCKLHTAHFTLYTENCTLHSELHTLDTAFFLFTMYSVVSPCCIIKSRIRETKHLSTDADSSTDTTVGWIKNTQKPNFF